MKKSVFLTITSFILYFLKSLIRGIIVGTFNIDESIAEICSSIFVLVIVFFMIRKGERLSYYGICKWKGDNFYKTNFFSLFLLSMCHIYFQVKN